MIVNIEEGSCWPATYLCEELGPSTLVTEHTIIPAGTGEGSDVVLLLKTSKKRQ